MNELNGYSIRARGLGAPRNGLPPVGGYKYQGDGVDQLTPPGVMAAWNRRVRRAAGSPEAGDRELARAEREIALRGSWPSQRPAVPLTVPRAPASGSRPPVAAAPRAPEPVAEPDPARVPAREPAREEAPPARCAGCGYLETARGHLVACGGAG